MSEHKRQQVQVPEAGDAESVQDIFTHANEGKWFEIDGPAFAGYGPYVGMVVQYDAARHTIVGVDGNRLLSPTGVGFDRDCENIKVLRRFNATVTLTEV